MFMLLNWWDGLLTVFTVPCLGMYCAMRASSYDGGAMPYIPGDKPVYMTELLQLMDAISEYSDYVKYDCFNSWQENGTSVLTLKFAASFCLTAVANPVTGHSL